MKQSVNPAESRCSDRQESANSGRLLDGSVRFSTNREVFANAFRGISKSPNINLYPLSAFVIPRLIVHSTPFAACALENCELRRSDAPVAARLPWYYMKVVVRNFLPAIDPVILKGQYG